MTALYLISVWLHIVAAVTWLGGMLFLTLVVVPWLHGEGRAGAVAFLRGTGRRYRDVAWTCFAILFVTGCFNLWMRDVRPGSVVDADWLASSFGRITLLKLVLFGVILTISATHDWLLGPSATRALQSDPRSADAAARRWQATLLGRLNLVLGLTMVACGVMLVRGVPW